MKTLALFTPERPCKGIRTKPHAFAYQDGYLKAGTNWRFDDQTAIVRDAVTVLSNGPLTADDCYRGAQVLIFAGVPYCFWAVYDSGTSSVKVFKSSDLATWTEITASGTRLTDNGTNVRFQALRAGSYLHSDSTPIGGVLFSNGSGYARYYDFTTTTLHQTLSAPKTTASTGVTFTMPSFWSLKNPANTTYTNSPQLVGSDGSTNPNNYIKLNVGAAPTGSDLCIMDGANLSFGSGTGPSRATKQLIMVVRHSGGLDDPDFINNIKLEVNDSSRVAGTRTTLYNGSNDQTYKVQSALLDASTKVWVYAFSMDPAYDNANLDVTAIDEIRVTWLSTTVASVEAHILCVCASGEIPSTAQFSVTHFNKLSQAESPPLLLPTLGTEYLQNLGGAAIAPASGEPNYKLPLAAGIYYSAKLSYRTPSATDWTAGVKYACIYRKDAGATEFFRLATNSYDDPFRAIASGNDYVTMTSTITYDYGVDGAFPAPSLYCKAAPAFTASEAAGGRLVVGNGSDLYLSAYDHPLRFSEIGIFDSSLNPVNRESAKHKIDGETVMAISQVSAYGPDATGPGTFGSGGVLFWTDKATYAIDTSNPNLSLTRMMYVGSSGRTAGVYNMASLILSHDRHLVAQGGGEPKILSLSTIEDLLAAIPSSRLAKTAICFHNHKAYIAYTESGGTRNRKILVYDLRLDRFTLDAMPATTGGSAYQSSAEGLALWPDSSSNRVRLLAFGHNGKLFEHETPGSVNDLGVSNAGVDVSLKSFAVTKQWNNAYHGRVGVVIDKITTTSLTVTRTVYGDGYATDGTIDLDATSASMNMNWENASAGAAVGGRAIGIDFTVAGALPGGTRLYTVVYEGDQPEGGGPSA